MYLLQIPLTAMHTHIICIYINHQAKVLTAACATESSMEHDSKLRCLSRSPGQARAGKTRRTRFWPVSSPHRGPLPRGSAAFPPPADSPQLHLASLGEIFRVEPSSTTFSALAYGREISPPAVCCRYVQQSGSRTAHDYDEKRR